MSKVTVLMTPLLAEKIAGQILDRACEDARRDAQRAHEIQEGRRHAEKIRGFDPDKFDEIFGRQA